MAIYRKTESRKQTAKAVVEKNKTGDCWRDLGGRHSALCIGDRMNKENPNISKQHGYSKHPLYRVWRHAKARCCNENNERYKYYGGRGITICDEWKNNPKAFIEWCLNNGWKKELEIDRINNNGNYTPENCRFVTHTENVHNARLLYDHNTSGYRGVNYKKANKKWRARISIDGKEKHLGYFDSARLAALRYDVEVYLLNDGRPRNLF